MIKNIPDFFVLIKISVFILNNIYNIIREMLGLPVSIINNV